MYDYVVVGAGSAGCVLAARLSENPATRVLLLEAGPPDDADEIHIPAAINLLFQSTYDWNYQTTPQERAAGRSIYWPRGRTLGGSSSISAMIYIRGSRYDYDTWRDEYGCEGWGYTDLLPYFLRAENNSRGASAFHGAEGPLSVQDPKHKSALTTAFVDAARQSGLEANNDFNGRKQDGVGFYQVTQRGGRRWSAADAYLHPAASRPNLTVQTDALVTGIALAGLRAVGVNYLLRGVAETARAENEVILACGTVGSPQLLMLSGIGPADHLRSHNIAVMADSPGVGANLSDHPMVTAMWHTPNEGLPAPDTQWHALPSPYQNGGLTDPSIRALSLLVTLVAVGSRGRIQLRSADPRHKPVIDPAYLSHGADIEPLVAGIQMAREFAAARPMSKICKSELAPGEGVRTDADIRDFIRHSLTTIYHPVGTCAMGGDSKLAASRLTSVVDPDLRVKGIDGLRVVDASVMPTVPRGNTNAPTIAIAEKAADLIAGRAPLAAIEPANAEPALPA